MLRLSTTSGVRISRAQQFSAHYGGGEANVAISLANYGHQVAFASKVPANNLGVGAIEHLRRAGVATNYVLTGGERLGTYYLEAGVGERAAQVIYDRKYSSFSLMEDLEWDLTELFAGVELFHISGITPALSQRWRELTIDLIKAAKKAGCLISFDINYRQKLWSQSEVQQFLKSVLPLVDICSAGSLDAQYLMAIPSFTGSKDEIAYYYQAMQARYPNIQLFYSTKRTVHSASHNDLVGTLWADGQYFESDVHSIDPIIDRVGGGDAFAGGVLHGILTQDTPQHLVEFATAASALEHTIHGDDNQFSVAEIEAFMQAGSGKIVR